MAREKCLPTCEWIRFVADVHSAVPAEGLARDGRVKHIVGKVLSALDDRVLNGRIDPYISALFENQPRTLAGELVSHSESGQAHPHAHAAVALGDPLLVHHDVPVFQGLVDLDSYGHGAAMA